MNFFRRFKVEIIISIIFVILASIATFPLVFNLSRQVYDYKGDLLETLWYSWWVKYAWQNDLSPEFVPIVAAPFGIDLSRDITKNINLSFANYPLLMLTVLMDEIAAYNIIMLLTFPLAGMAMYFMTYYFTREKWGSFFSGLVFAFCPYHFAHASHITLANIQWIPLFILFLFKTHNERTYLNAVLCGVFFALTFLSDTYYGYFMLVTSASFIIFKIFHKGFDKKRVHFVPKVGGLKNLLLLFIAPSVAALVVFPYLYPIFKSYLLGNAATFSLQGYVRDISELYLYSYKLFNYFFPAVNHPVFGSFTQKFVGSIFYGENLQEQSFYLGWTTILLAIFGCRFWKEKSAQMEGAAERERINFAVSFFIFLAVVCFLFSLSPTFMILGKVVKLPSYYVYQVLPFFRAIARFGIVVMISLCVLAGFGIRFLLEKMDKKWKVVTIGCFLPALLIFEFANVPPFKTTELGKASEVYQWLKEESSDSLVIEYPIGNDVEYLFYQRVHKKKLVNGALKGTEAYSITEKITDILKPSTAEILRRLGVKYVILHPSRYNERSEREEILKALKGFEKNYGLVLIEQFGDAMVFIFKEGKE